MSTPIWSHIIKFYHNKFYRNYFYAFLQLQLYVLQIKVYFLTPISAVIRSKMKNVT